MSHLRNEEITAVCSEIKGRHPGDGVGSRLAVGFSFISQLIHPEILV